LNAHKIFRFRDIKNFRKQFLNNILPFHKLFKNLAQRDNKHTHNGITYSVNNVPRQTRSYPGKCLLKTKTHHQSLRGCIKYAEQKAVDTAYGRIDNAFYSFGHFFRQKHCCRPKNRPNVQIGHPPECEAGIQAVHHYIQIYRYKCLFAEYNGICHCEHTQKMNVWQDFH